jgi:hypothetical protein
MTTITQDWLRSQLQDNGVPLQDVLTIDELPETLLDIGNHTFANCSGLTAITLPESLTRIGNYAFSGCSGLTAITLPKSLTHIGECAFFNCSGLTAITFPESLTHIGNYAFTDCSGLTAITLPKSLTHIGGFAFAGCSGLTAITLPKGLTHIGNYAFANCTAMPSGYILAPESLEIDIKKLWIPETTKIIRYNDFVHTNPIAATRALYQRIITECGYTTPEKHKQVQKHLVESFLKPEQLLKSALKTLKLFKKIPVRRADNTIITDQLLKTIHDYLGEGCQILKSEMTDRELDHGAAQKALNTLIEKIVPRSVATDLFKSCVLPHLSQGFRVLMDPTLTSPFADQPSLPKKANPIDQGPGGGGGGADGNTLTP